MKKRKTEYSYQEPGIVTPAPFLEGFSEGKQKEGATRKSQRKSNSHEGRAQMKMIGRHFVSFISHEVGRSRAPQEMEKKKKNWSKGKSEQAGQMHILGDPSEGNHPSEIYPQRFSDS